MYNATFLSDYGVALGICLALALVLWAGIWCIRHRTRQAVHRAVWARKRWIKEGRFPKRPYRMFL